MVASARTLGIGVGISDILQDDDSMESDLPGVWALPVFEAGRREELNLGLRSPWLFPGR